MSPAFSHRFCLLFLLLLGLLLRLPNLTSGPISLDEGYTILAAKAAIVPQLLRGPCDWNPPAATLPYTVWSRVFGNSRLAVESLSVCFGQFSLLLLYFLGRRLFSARVAIIAVFLCAVSKYHIIFSQYARIYSFALFALLLGLLLLVEWVDHPNMRKIIFFFISAFFVMNLHYYAALVVATVLFFIVINGNYNKRVRLQSFSAGIVLGLCLLPSLLWQSQILSRIREESWIEPLSINTVASIWYHFSSESILLLIILVSLCVTGVRGGLSTFQGQQSTKFLLYWLFFPIIIAILFSVLAGPILHVRYFIFCLPAFLLLAANGWTLLPNRTLRVTILILLCLGSFSSLRNYFEKEAVLEGDSRIYSILGEGYRSGDVVYHTSKCSFVSSVFANHFALPEFEAAEAASKVLLCSLGNPVERDLIQDLNPTRIWTVDTDCYPLRASRSSIELPGFIRIRKQGFPNGELSLYEKSPNLTSLQIGRLPVIGLEYL